MIKQPYQVLKWYNKYGEQQYFKLQNFDMGWQWPKYFLYLPPSWCIKRDIRIDTLDYWTMNSLDGAVSVDMTDEVTIHPGYCNFKIRTDGSTYDYLFYTSFPMRQSLEPGFYYYEVSDGVEIWYSEIFELCEYWTKLVDGSTNSAPAWDTHTPFDFGNYFRVILAEVTANGAQNYTNSFEVIYNEKLQLYIYESLTAKTGYLRVYLEDANTLEIISEIYDIEEGCNDFTLIPQKTCTARLRFALSDSETYSAWVYVWMYYYYIESGRTECSSFSVLRWYDSQNFCDLPYAEGFKNYLVLDGRPHNNYTRIEEEVEENDQKNKFPLIQTIQKWFNFVFSGGDYLVEGLSMLRLHETVTLTLETGTEIDIKEISLDSEPLDDFMYKITLDFREDSCSKDACTFNISCCCPTERDVYDTTTIGALLSCETWRYGDRYLVDVGAGVFYIYECDGVNWIRQTDEEYRNSCVYDQDLNASEDNNQYWGYNPDSGEFQYVCELSGVMDLGTGLVEFLNSGDILTSDVFDCNYYVQGQMDVGGGYVDIGDPITGDEFVSGGLIIYVGAVIADFRLRIYTPNCDLMYSSEYNMEITEV